MDKYTYIDFFIIIHIIKTPNFPSMSFLNRIEDEITKIQSEFYSSQPRQFFLKKSQKNECADFVTSQLCLDELIQNTIYVIPNTKSIYMDYPVFKCYATAANYEKIVSYILQLIDQLISHHNEFDIHVNLSTFTLTAAERYSQMLQLFCETICKRTNTNFKYTDYMRRMHIYNTPNTIHLITPILSKFTNDSISDKIAYFSKEQSVDTLQRIQEFGRDVSSSSSSSSSNKTV